MLASRTAVQGALRYLRGIEWRLVDELAIMHWQITAKTMLLWGENDPTVPLHRAKAMATQFEPAASLVVIADAKLLPHEDKPAQLLSNLLPFLSLV